MPNKQLYSVTRPTRAHPHGAFLRAYEIELDGIPHRSLRGNTRTDRRAATTERALARQSGKDHGTYLIASQGVLGPLEAFEIRYTVWHDRTTIDLDNLMFGFKPFCDGLEESGLIASDSVRHLRQLSIAWGGRVKRGESRTLVEITETEPSYPQPTHLNYLLGPKLW